MKNALKIMKLEDYEPLGFDIEKVNMLFHLGKQKTLVYSELHIRNNSRKEIFLDGIELELLDITLNKRKLKEGRDYALSEEGIVLKKSPKEFKLKTKVAIFPDKNKSLLGIYVTGELLCTKCESEGFRRIAFFPDRPDAMSRYTVSVKADKDEFPVLLANGNLVSYRKLKGNIHKATYKDPYKKSCYLFAVVAGKLDVLSSKFKTMSGRKVDLNIYVEKGKTKMATHAMFSLKKAMRWDEKKYGREYDLKAMGIVATKDMFVAACETKGINIFNDRYILVDEQISTEDDYKLVDEVIAHEYFHNWSGNRVTIRDWFNLVMKEGLTVFREQEYVYDNYDRSYERINDALFMEEIQFKQEASSGAFPMLPRKYANVRDIYMPTAYQKGAEFFRMLSIFTGREAFDRALVSYFKKYDGKAVTCDAFLEELEKSSRKNMSGIRLWLDTLGVPTVTVKERYDADSNTYRINLSHDKEADLIIPMKIGMIVRGRLVEDLIILDNPYKTLTFKNVMSRPVLSINRDFSSPVIINHRYSDDDLLVLLKHETDNYVKYNAFRKYLLGSIVKTESGNVVSIFRSMLEDKSMSGEMKAFFLSLPSVDEISNGFSPRDFMKAERCREAMKKFIAKELEENFRIIFMERSDAKKLVNKTMSYLSCLEWYRNDILEYYRKADNMTDKQAAFAVIANNDWQEREDVIADFYGAYKDNDLVVNKWFSIQASSRLSGTLKRVSQLLEHERFSYYTPNKVFALLGSFSKNSIHFHANDGSGYRLLADNIIKIEKSTPSVANLLLDYLVFYDNLPQDLEKHLKEVLNRIKSSVRTVMLLDKINKKLRDCK